MGSPNRSIAKAVDPARATSVPPCSTNSLMFATPPARCRLCTRAPSYPDGCRRRGSARCERREHEDVKARAELPGAHAGVWQAGERELELLEQPARPPLIDVRRPRFVERDARALTGTADLAGTAASVRVGMPRAFACSIARELCLESGARNAPAGMSAAPDFAGATCRNSGSPSFRMRFTAMNVSLTSGGSTSAAPGAAGIAPDGAALTTASRSTSNGRSMVTVSTPICSAASSRRRRTGGRSARRARPSAPGSPGARAASWRTRGTAAPSG